MNIDPFDDLDQIGEPRFFANLEEFNTMATQIINGDVFDKDDDGLVVGSNAGSADENEKRFALFMLTGIHPDTETQAHIALNAYRAEDVAAGKELQVIQDFDSFNWTSRSLPYKTAVGLYCIPRPEATLTKNVKLSHTLNGSNKSVPLHQIPNFIFGTCNDFHKIRLFFPARWSEHVSVRYDDDLARQVYNECTYPAILNVLPERTNHFPISRESEDFRASRHRSGQIVHSTFNLPFDMVRHFTQRFFEILSRKPYGEGAFFQHEIRNVKNQGIFDQGEGDDGIDVLQTILSFVNIDQVSNEHSVMYVDLGFEIGFENHVALWKSASHDKIIEKVLGCTREKARKLRKGSNCTKDLAAHFDEAAGLQLIVAGSNQFNVKFLNVYHTEKEPTYLIDGNHFGKFIYPTDFLKAKSEKMDSLEQMEKSITTFYKQREKNGFAARLEPRLPLAHFMEDPNFLILDDGFCKENLYLVPNDVWWTFKSLRQSALHIISMQILKSSATLIGLQETLTLIAILAYMNNALCSRPAEGKLYNPMLSAALRHAVVDFEDESADETISPFGVFFISGINYSDGCPGLRPGRVIPPTRLAKLFGLNDISLVLDLLPQQRSVATPLPARFQNNVSNKQKRTAKYFTGDLDHDGLLFTHREIENLRIRLPEIIEVRTRHPPALRLAGYAQAVSDAEALTIIWRQAFLDLGAKLPKPASPEAPSYVIRIPGIMVDESFFKEKHLTRIFNSVGFSKNNTNGFKDQFDFLFPPWGSEEKLPGKAQNWNACIYRRSYFDLMNKLHHVGTEGKRTFNSVRELLRKEFDEQIVFVPKMEKARATSTRVRDRGDGPAFVYPRNYPPAKPTAVVVLNPKFYNLVQRNIDQDVKNLATADGMVLDEVVSDEVEDINYSRFGY